MTTHSLYFIAGICIFVSALSSIAAYSYIRNLRSSRVSWDHLMAKLNAIDRENIARVALDLIDESGEPRTRVEEAGLEPGQIWKLIGGLDGLEMLETNSEVLIDLAFYLQRWHPEAVAIAERLRLDARQIKWHVERLKGAAQTGNLQISFPFYAQRAVVTYYLMTRRVLSLYEAGSFSMFADLQKAL